MLLQARSGAVILRGWRLKMACATSLTACFPAQPQVGHWTPLHGSRIPPRFPAPGSSLTSVTPPRSSSRFSWGAERAVLKVPSNHGDAFHSHPVVLVYSTLSVPPARFMARPSSGRLKDVSPSDSAAAPTAMLIRHQRALAHCPTAAGLGPLAICLVVRLGACIASSPHHPLTSGCQWP